MKNCKRFFNFCIAFLLGFISLIAYADEEKPLLNAEPQNGYWVFSGIVNDENDQQYGYFFQMQREADTFRVQASIIDETKNQLIFSYENSEKLEAPVDFQWKIGKSFLHYNPINESWVFGVKLDNKKGFNFKVDMLNQTLNHPETIRPGIEFVVQQTNRLNGHINIEGEDKEFFITANNAWFSKLWASLPQKESHKVKSGLCRFKDGSGFYTENLEEKDTERGSLASWRDSNGVSVKMSQFVNIKPIKDNIWKVQVQIPKVDFEFENSLMSNPGKMAGFFKQIPQGFCFFNEQNLG